MKTITVSEFRKNIKKYVDIALKEKVIVNRGEGKAFAIIPIDPVLVRACSSYFRRIFYKTCIFKP